MSQILDPLPSDENDNILCCYVNATSQIQIARITNIPNWYFERVVFPGQRLVFESSAEAILEIHSGMMASAILSDTIPCLRLALRAVSAEQEKVKKTSKEESNNAQAIAMRNSTSKTEISQPILQFELIRKIEIC